MKIWVLSDLHIESCRWDLPDPRPDYDVLVAAGDILTPFSKGVEWLAVRAQGKPVIYVPGNHEWYSPRNNFTIPEEKERAAELAVSFGIHLLMTSSVVIDGVRFLGTTLWTDYDLHGDREYSMKVARLGMNDHRLIFPVYQGVPLAPEMARDWHLAERSWLEESLTKKPTEGGPFQKTVVITHHSPHASSVHKKYSGDPFNPAYHSDLSLLVEGGGADLWIHGHTHSSFDYVAGGTRVVCNPKGYGPGVWNGIPENKEFQDGFVVNL